MNEFELIKHCFNWPQNNEHIIHALGDDASIVQVPSGYDLVQSIDTQVADVHFPATAPAELIAQRALRCAVSDLAAMGAKPQAFHLAISLPSNTPQSWLETFSKGLRTCAEEYNIPLIGGDTTASPTLVITLQVQGIVPSGAALTRHLAKAGDSIWLSGKIGQAAAALPNILAHPENIRVEVTDSELTRAYFYPQAQIALGQKLIGIASSAIDISDGLLQDATHIAKASEVCLDFALADIPLSQCAINLYGHQQALQYALSGGDDYQLLFTAPASAQASLQQLGCYQVGQVVAKQTRPAVDDWILINGQSIENKNMGYQHF